jgi:hypothetical protein
MPVSRSDFQRGRTEPSSSELVLSFLHAHPEKAYSAVEIATAIKKGAAGPEPAKGTTAGAKVGRALESAGGMLGKQQFKLSLDWMVAHKQLAARRVKANGKTATYYRFVKPKKIEYVET